MYFRVAYYGIRTMRSLTLSWAAFRRMGPHKRRSGKAKKGKNILANSSIGGKQRDLTGNGEIMPLTCPHGSPVLGQRGRMG